MRKDTLIVRASGIVSSEELVAIRKLIKAQLEDDQPFIVIDESIQELDVLYGLTNEDNKPMDLERYYREVISKENPPEPKEGDTVKVYYEDKIIDCVVDNVDFNGVSLSKIDKPPEDSGDDRKGIVAKHPNDGGITLFGSSVITSGTIKPNKYKPTNAEQRANQVYILMSQMGMSSEEAIAALNDMERSGDK